VGVVSMSNINITVDDDLTKQVELICSELGIDLTIATTMFFKQMVRCNGIPFEIRADPFYSAENQSRLLAAKGRMEQSGGTVHEIIEVEDD